MSLALNIPPIVFYANTKPVIRKTEIKGFVSNEPPADKEPPNKNPLETTPQDGFKDLHGILLVLIFILQLLLTYKVMSNQGNNNSPNPLPSNIDTTKKPNHNRNESGNGIYRRMFQKNQYIGFHPSTNVINQVPSALLWNSKAKRGDNLQMPRQSKVFGFIKNKADRPNKAAIQKAPNIWGDNAIPVNHPQI
jgi:hypothetical protein